MRRAVCIWRGHRFISSFDLGTKRELNEYHQNQICAHHHFPECRLPANADGLRWRRRRVNAGRRYTGIDAIADYSKQFDPGGEQRICCKWLDWQFVDWRQFAVDRRERRRHAPRRRHADARVVQALLRQWRPGPADRRLHHHHSGLRRRGGTIAVNGTIAGTNGPTNGDKFSVTASNCVEDGATINGTLAMAFSNVSGNLFGAGAGAATMDLTFTDFSVAEGTTSATVAGDMKLVMSQTSAGNVNLAISGTSLQSVERKAGVKISDFRLSNYTATVAGSGSTFSVSANYGLAGTFGSLGQVSVTVNTLQPFVVGASGVPSAGSLIVNGAASSVTATVVPANKVRLDYSAKGDGVITQTNTIDWATFVVSL